MVCTDHDRFLEISDVIHRLKLTILKGVMENNADNSSWARFIVEVLRSYCNYKHQYIPPIKNYDSCCIQVGHRQLRFG